MGAEAEDKTEGGSPRRFRRLGFLITALGVAIALASTLLIVLARRGNATLRVDILSLPRGIPARVVVTGAKGFSRTVPSTEVLGGLNAGSYTVRADPVPVGDSTYHPAARDLTVWLEKDESEKAVVDYLVVVPQEVVVLGEDILSSLTHVSDGQKVLRFSSRLALSNGDIVVAGVSPQTPEGLLRQVTQVRQLGEALEVHTAPAALADAVSRGRLQLAEELSVDEIASSEPLVSGASFRRGSIVVEIRSRWLVGGGGPCSGRGDIDIRGSILLDPSFSFSASWTFGKGISAAVSAGGRQITDLSLISRVGAFCEGRIPLYSFYFTPITVFLGPVPVVFVPNLTLFLDVEGMFSTSLEIGARHETSFSAGLRYEDGVLSPSRDFSNNFETKPQAMQPFEARPRLAVGPSIDLLLYGIAGPSVHARAYLRAEISPQATPWWILYGGLSAGARVDLNAVIRGIGLNLRDDAIIAWEEVLAKAEGEPPVPKLVLSGTGLGAVNFGDDPENVIAVVSAALGPPTKDSGWRPLAEFPFPFAPEGTARVVEWGDLTLIFSDIDPQGSPGSRRFVSWRIPGESDRTSTLRTAKGIGIGSTAGELRAAYPDVQFRWGEQGPGGQHIFSIDDDARFGGTLRGYGPQGTFDQAQPIVDDAEVITHMDAGFDPTFFCC